MMTSLRNCLRRLRVSVIVTLLTVISTLLLVNLTYLICYLIICLFPDVLGQPYRITKDKC